ncbi:MAG: MATE family efflux transporter [Eubacteriales bacterium]|nr:MATE family efflux transporter [Eubacteriales bacterium]
MFTAIKDFFTVRGMVGKQAVLGDLPKTKELYLSYLKVAWPAIAESVLVGLVSFIDTMMVSVLGTAAVAAVGLTGQPKLIIFAVFFALNISVTAIVSRRKGQEDREGANKTLAQALSLCFVLAVVLCGVGIIVAEPFMRLAGANEDTLADSVVYFRIVVVGLLFTAISGVINSAQRAIGNTKIAMTSNLTANLVNICLNYVLIGGNLGFPMLGVKGAAIATMIGNITACFMSIISVSHKNGYLKLKLNECFRWNREVIKPIILIGSGAGTEQIAIRIGFFLYATAVANLGTVAFATHQICMNILSLSFTFGDGLGVAASSLVGQNLGKRRSDLSYLYGKTGQRVGFFVSMLLVILFVFGGKSLMLLFTGPDEVGYESIIKNGVIIMYFIAICSPAQISQVIFSGCLRGAGDTKFVAFVSLISIGIGRPILTYLFCYPLGWGLIGAWISLIVDQYTRFAFSAARFTSGKWSGIKV